MTPSHRAVEHRVAESKSRGVDSPHGSRQVSRVVRRCSLVDKKPRTNALSTPTILPDEHSVPSALPVLSRHSRTLVDKKHSKTHYARSLRTPFGLCDQLRKNGRCPWHCRALVRHAQACPAREGEGRGCDQSECELVPPDAPLGMRVRPRGGDLMVAGGRGRGEAVEMGSEESTVVVPT